MAIDVVRRLRENIADLLKQARLLHKMSQQDFALLINCAPEQIDAYENGRMSISAIDLYIIAKSLGVPVENFFAPHNLGLPSGENILEQNAYGFLKSYSEVDDAALRRKILEMCTLYEELQEKPIL